eukprot:SAG22_NODE_4854_length_1150_cov_1.662226_1_plen_169_part_10
MCVGAGAEDAAVELDAVLGFIAVPPLTTGLPDDDDDDDDDDVLAIGVPPLTTGLLDKECSASARCDVCSTSLSKSELLAPFAASFDDVELPPLDFVDFGGGFGSESSLPRFRLGAAGSGDLDGGGAIDVPPLAADLPPLPPSLLLLVLLVVALGLGSTPPWNTTLETIS